MGTIRKVGIAVSKSVLTESHQPADIEKCIEPSPMLVIIRILSRLNFYVSMKIEDGRRRIFILKLDYM